VRVDEPPCHAVVDSTRRGVTASMTTPVDSTACTTDSGASASAATCSAQAPAPTTIPIANQRAPISTRALRSGPAHCTRGTQFAPRCLHR
jgi:hypothetical protein